MCSLLHFLLTQPSQECGDIALRHVPAIVLVAIYGVHDGSGRPGLFDSVIQAAWSFCLALRSRGLGSAWTTIHLNAADQVAELQKSLAALGEFCLGPSFGGLADAWGRRGRL